MFLSFSWLLDEKHVFGVFIKYFLLLEKVKKSTRIFYEFSYNIKNIFIIFSDIFCVYKTYFQSISPISVLEW